jgi:hypothetical protein
MGGFAQGLGQGFGNVQAMSADLQARREQAELFKLKSKQLKLERARHAASGKPRPWRTCALATGHE